MHNSFLKPASAISLKCILRHKRVRIAKIHNVRQIQNMIDVAWKPTNSSYKFLTQQDQAPKCYKLLSLNDYGYDARQRIQNDVKEFIYRFIVYSRYK